MRIDSLFIIGNLHTSRYVSYSRINQYTAKKKKEFVVSISVKCSAINTIVWVYNIPRGFKQSIQWMPHLIKLFMVYVDAFDSAVQYTVFCNIKLADISFNQFYYIYIYIQIENNENNFSFPVFFPRQRERMLTVEPKHQRVFIFKKKCQLQYGSLF